MKVCRCKDDLTFVIIGIGYFVLRAAGEKIADSIFFAGPVDELEVVISKEERSAGLSSGQMLHGGPEFEIAVVGENFEWFWKSFEVVAPVL